MAGPLGVPGAGSMPLAPIHPPRRLPVGAILAGALLIASFSGYALGGGLRVTSPTLLTSSGQFDAANDVGTWWLIERVVYVLVPSTLPTSVSGAAASPTVLPSNATVFLAGSGTAGQAGVEFVYNETAGPHASTELELKLNVAINGGAPSTLTVYIETQSTVPAATHSYGFMVDTGPSPQSHTLLESVRVSVLPCTSVGTCP